MNTREELAAPRRLREQRDLVQFARDPLRQAARHRQLSPC